MIERGRSALRLLPSLKSKCEASLSIKVGDLLFYIYLMARAPPNVGWLNFKYPPVSSNGIESPPQNRVLMAPSSINRVNRVFF